MRAKEKGMNKGEEGDKEGVKEEGREEEGRGVE